MTLKSQITPIVVRPVYAPALVVFLTRLLWALLHPQRGIWVARVVGFALGLVLGSALLSVRLAR